MSAPDFKKNDSYNSANITLTLEFYESYSVTRSSSKLYSLGSVATEK